MNDVGADLSKLVRFTAAVRTVNAVFPTQCLHVLLAVASRPGVTQRELEKATGLSHASISRNVNALGAHHRNGKRGFGLVAQVPSMADSRASNVFLTSKGLEVVQRLLQAATGKPADCFSPRVVR